MVKPHVTMTPAAVLAMLLAVVVAAPADAAPSRSKRAKSRVALKQVVEQVTGSTAHRYGAVDDRGAALEGLKVVQVGDRYVGVYHSPGGGRFNVHVATSRDLITWTRRETIETDASQPTIALTPGDGVVVAYEHTTLSDLIARPPLLDALLPGPLKILDDPLNRIRIRFRHYRTVDDLLTGRHSREFTAPRRLSPTAEGTPSITSAVLRDGLISRSRIEVGLHYFANRRGEPKVDRRATAVLEDFRRWKVQARPDLDATFLESRLRHDGYGAAPLGSIGDRDPITLDGVRLELAEAQYVAGDFGSWRTFLVDPRAVTPRPLEIATAGASRAFGNPSVTELRAPSGRRAVFVSVYVFSEGAAAHEAGPLIYYRER